MEGADSGVDSSVDAAWISAASLPSVAFNPRLAAAAAPSGRGWDTGWVSSGGVSAGAESLGSGVLVELEIPLDANLPKVSNAFSTCSGANVSGEPDILSYRLLYIFSIFYSSNIDNQFFIFSTPASGTRFLPKYALGGFLVFARRAMATAGTGRCFFFV